MPAQVDLPREPIIAFCKKWKVARLDLFGSVLREDFGPDSDIDLLISFLPEHGRSLFDLVTMELELEQIVGRKVDFAIREAVEESYNWIRRRAILEAADLFYAA